ncbi:class I SAM-dependent methyltransferase [Shewanella glacialipiscicola]|uniref:class I SAM-dependent methyltransferase n=1 Tax=Shewanella glacialipiscicola TaxID=614069 RepID=UPI003D7BDC69
MDPVTQSVQQMYEQYPYPSGLPNMTAGFDIRLLLSYVEQSPKDSRPYHALEAGCGRGPAVLAAATLQPEVTFSAMDINTVGLKEATLNAEQRGLNNLTFHQVDLMALTGITVPEGGFDVIHCAGVLHHTADPQLGLNNLAEILAPHGVMSIMLYGTYGRQALYRLIDCIDILSPIQAQISERIAPGRLLAEAAEDSLFKDNYWSSTYLNPDVEFVDTCLNVKETSFDVTGLWQFIENAGMKFVRWVEPDVWSVDKRIKNPELRARLKALSEFEQYKIMERLFEIPKLEFIICKNTNQQRVPTTAAAVEASGFAVNPEVSFQVTKRNLNNAQRIESVAYKVRGREAVIEADPILGSILLLLSEQNSHFSGADMLNVLIQHGASRDYAYELIDSLRQKEVIFVPHCR